MVLRHFKEAIVAKTTYWPDRLKRGNRQLAINDRHRYRTIKLITDGGASGEIYIARDKATMKPMIVKRAKPGKEHEIDFERDSFIHVGPHPNIMPMVASFKDSSNRPCLVLPVMEKTLWQYEKERIAEEKLLPSDEIAVFIFQLLRALNKVHGQGRVHRDVKPTNIFLEGPRRLFLGDFGSCGNESDLANAYIVTRQYRPPEVAYGRVPYSSKLDIWSVGCIFAELFIGRMVFNAGSNDDLKKRFFEMIGYPNEDEWAALLPPGQLIPADMMGLAGNKLREILTTAAVPKEGIKLMERMLRYNPGTRPSALRAMASPYFKDIRKEAKHFWLLEGWTIDELANHDQHLIQQVVPLEFWTPEMHSHFAVVGQQHQQA